MKPSESELTGPVCRWLRRRGLIAYCEVPAQGRCVDIVAVGAQLVAVELKASLSKTVIYQAMTTQNFADQSWCAVPTNPRCLDSAERRGVGVLRVSNGRVKILLQAVTNSRPFPGPQLRMRERLAGMEAGGLAGIPTPYGDGPAQRVARLVAPLYRAGIPWREIWSRIPNHYASHKSMAGVMRNYGPARRILDE